MSNRFATIALIVVVSILSAGVFFFVGLFLFPGMSMFGMRYIGPGTHKYYRNMDDIELQVGEFRDIVVNTSEVPVEVVFVTETNYKFIYYDNYNGLTKGSVDEPSLDVGVNESGQLVFTTHEYKKFLYESTTSVRYLKIFIPLFKVDASLSMTNRWSLIINSDKSDIYFGKYSSQDPRDANFYDLKIKTDGKINFNPGKLLNDQTYVAETQIKAENFHYTSNNSILIDENKTNVADATNYYLNSLRGNIDISCLISGDLEATTNQGSIKLVSCNNFTAKTSYGTIGFGGSEEDGEILVKGSLNIDSRAGSVNIGTVRGTSNIKTTSGNVKIAYELVGNAKIETTRGSVDITKGSSLEISTNIGKVKVLEATSKVKVSTMRGNIYLGSEEKTVKNIDAFSRIGKVYVNSAGGTVKIQTISSAVEFTNGTSQNINIESGGKLIAKRLMGTVTIKAEDDIEKIEFEDITLGNTEIVLADGCRSAQIDCLNNKPNEVHYFLKGASVSVYEYSNNQYHPQNNGSSIDNLTETENINCKFKVEGNKANIRINFKAKDAE